MNEVAFLVGLFVLLGVILMGVYGIYHKFTGTHARHDKSDAMLTRLHGDVVDNSHALMNINEGHKIIAKNSEKIKETLIDIKHRLDK